MPLFIEKMRRDGAHAAAIDAFMVSFRQLEQRNAAFLPESAIDPILRSDIVSLDTLGSNIDDGADALRKTAILKLNGGMGTTMGLTGPKSLIQIKGEQTFLDIALGQVRVLNRRYGGTVPFVLMSSFFTESATGEWVARQSSIDNTMLLHFSQHRFPRINAATFEPFVWPGNPSGEWSPPGHGDLLLSLVTTGTLDLLLGKGYRYLFVSNIDNLGASLDLSILGYFTVNKLDFLMEVTDRTPMDRKGGHLARRKSDERLVLREVAQCPPEDHRYFSDIDRHPFFNTNSLWIRLASIARAVAEKSHHHLPLVVNRKQLGNGLPEIIQLESALGSAISLFDRTAAVLVPRSRFAPVKSCDELLLLWSDFFSLNDDWMIEESRGRSQKRVTIDLDQRYYSRVDLLKKRFPHGAPSLIDCESLTVRGDVRFGPGVVIKGRVTITSAKDQPTEIPAGTILTGDILL